MTEFWRRWHMTLSRWLRDYLYIPLGGNRGGRLIGYRNVMITMLLGGLWHGAGWTFVMWGGLQGIYLVGERVTGVADAAADTITGMYARRVFVFGLWVFSMIFFRMPTLGDALAVFDGILHVSTLEPAYLASQFATLKGLAVIALSMLIDWASVNRSMLEAYRHNPVFRYGLLATSVWGILFLGVFGSNSFIYFQF
jgi:D-alanyl-lipoteichoic acid acyltransferase DltB (MBOAT superfamily)